MWLPIVLSFSLMFTSAYIDNIRGPLLPLLTQTLNLSYKQSSSFLSIANLMGVLSLLYLIRLIRKFQEKKSIQLLLIFTAAGILLAQAVSNFFLLILLGGFLGVTIATLGAMGNILIIQGVPHNVRGRWMSGLHMMYGVGSVLAPLIVGKMLAFGASWNSIFALGWIPVFILLLTVFFKFPKLEAKDPSQDKPIHLNAIHWLAIFAFAIYVAAEVLCSNWLVTYLTVAKGLSIESASRFLSGFFLAMGIGRGLCLLFLSPRAERVVIVGGQVLFIVFFFLGLKGFWLGFSLAGILGPYFPVFVSRMTVRFPERANRITLIGLSLSQLSLVVSHQIMGLVTDQFGIETSFYLPIAIMVISLSLTGYYLNRE